MIASSGLTLSGQAIETARFDPLSQYLRSGSLLAEIGGAAGDVSLLADGGGAVFLDGAFLRLAPGAVLDPALGIEIVVEVAGVAYPVHFAVADEGQAILRGGAGDEVFDIASESGRQILLTGAGIDLVMADSSDLVAYSRRRVDYEITVVDSRSSGGGYGGYGDGAGNVRYELRDLRVGGEGGSDLILSASGTGLRFADGDLGADALLGEVAGPITLEGRALEVAALVIEDQPGARDLGALGILGGDLGAIAAIEVLGFRPGRIFPDDLTAQGLVEVDAAGHLWLTGPVDAEVHESLALRVFYTDQSGRSGFDVLTLGVVARDDAPVVAVAPGLGGAHVLSDQANKQGDVFIGAVSVLDADGSVGALTYQLSGADAGLFRVDEAGLWLRGGMVLDTGADRALDLQIAVGDGAHDLGAAVDLDLMLRHDTLLQSLDWGFQMPQEIAVYLVPGGAAISEHWDYNPLYTATYPSLSLTAAMVGAYEAVFDLISEVSQIRFSFTTDPEAADMAVVLAPSTRDSSAYSAVGGGVLEIDDGAYGLGNWVVMNAAILQNLSMAPGSFGFWVVMHEVMHALGTDHPHDALGASGLMVGVEGEQDLGLFDLNQTINTVLSYVQGWVTGDIAGATLASGQASGLGALDIALLQSHYGTNATTRSGDDIYHLNDGMLGAIWDGGGRDRIVYDGSGDAVIRLGAATIDYSVHGGGPVSYVHGGTGARTIAQGVLIEEAEGGAGQDEISGNAAANLLLGAGGDDRISGRNGADRLEGGTGDDWLVGGAGADLILGGAGLDTAAYGSSDRGVAVDLALGRGTGGDAQGDRLEGIEALVGSGFGDVLTGDAADNRLTGRAGDDLLRGGGGADLLVGGQGADTLDGGAGIDRASYAASDSGIEVDLALGTGRGGDAEGDVLIGIEHLIGTAFHDHLHGDGGANTLNGGAGDDEILGGAGADRLIGGAGADVFVFGLGMGRDIIADFALEDALHFAAGLVTQDLAAIAREEAGQLILRFNAADQLRLLGWHLGDLADLRVEMV
jgi:Ca2+-binding RTX toxin-like protein